MQKMSERHLAPLKALQNIATTQPVQNLHNRIVVPHNTMPLYMRTWSDIAVHHFCRAWRYNVSRRDDGYWRTEFECKED